MASRLGLYLVHGGADGGDLLGGEGDGVALGLVVRVRPAVLLRVRAHLDRARLGAAFAAAAAAVGLGEAELEGRAQGGLVVGGGRQAEARERVAEVVVVEERVAEVDPAAGLGAAGEFMRSRMVWRMALKLFSLGLRRSTMLTSP